MIKFALRRNLIYVLQYIIWSFARDILIKFINSIFNFSTSYIFVQLIFLGEILAGAIIYLSLKKYNKKKKTQYFMSIKLRKSSNELQASDSKIKIFFLIFLLGFMDLVEFSLCNIYLPRLINLSQSLFQRLIGITTMFSLFFYVYALKLPVYRHQKFSILIIGICLIAIIVSEFFFQKIDIYSSHKSLSVAIAYIAIGQILWSCMDSIEKYLFEYNFMNPFIVLMYEGTTGFFLSFLNLLDKNYFYDLVEIYKNNTTGKFVGFIFMLIAYIILSGGKNIFRVITTKIYSPMVTTLQDYVLNPIYLIYYFCAHNDFKNNGKLYVLYFIINIIISLIISFFGCVYNEFIILFFCGLEYNTHDQVSKRADIKIGENNIELNNTNDEEILNNDN